MNERIKELYEQSLTHTTGKDHAGNPMAIIKQNPEKFAELIVRECMRMCDTAQMGYLTHGLEKEASGAVSVKQYIEEHFGVEE